MSGVRKNSIEARLAELEKVGVAALHDRWSKLCDEPVPNVPEQLLRRLVAYRVQERRYGGLPLALRKEILTGGAVARKQGQNATSELSPGTCLVREWQGQTVTVVIGDDGSVEWNGKSYRSLSEVARLVTGTRWSGPRFFGLGTSC